MAIGKKGFEIIHITRVLGRKRIVLSNFMEGTSLSSPFSTLSRKPQTRRAHMEQSNRLESLPHDVLVRLLCKVNHSDLKHLLLVAKFVSQTALIAREIHFKYSTPLSKLILNRDCSSGGVEQGESTPNAPMQHRVAKSQRDPGKLGSLAVCLFASPEVQRPEMDSPTDV